MPKLFVTSDIHGNYKELRRALNEAGFDEDNEDHILVVCGDVWDRHYGAIQVMKYLHSLPRVKLIGGNHELLFQECCKRGYAEMYDYSNGTFDTVCELGGADVGRSFDECCVIAEQRAKDFLDSFVNYFETSNYIFVHSFVPLKCNDNLPAYYTRNRKFEIDPDWRYAHNNAWDTAKWGNPYELAERGLLPDKTLVFGHFHTSWPRSKYEGKPEVGDGADFGIYYGKGYIAIDGCVHYTGKLNVLVLEDNLLDPLDKS